MAHSINLIQSIVIIVDQNISNSFNCIFKLFQRGKHANQQWATVLQQVPRMDQE